MKDIVSGLKYEEHGLSLRTPMKYSKKVFSSDSNIRLHYHRSLEINICHNLKGSIYAAGQETILQNDSVILIPPGMPHSYRFRRNSGTIEVFHFLIEALPGVETVVEDTVFYRIIPLIELSDEFFLLLNKMRPDLSEDYPSILKLTGVLMLLIDELHNYSNIHRPEVPFSESDSFILRVIDFTEQRFSHTISLDDISSHAGVSKYHFCRTFKKKTGENWSGYLRSVRLSNSLQLLNKGFSVIDAAEACGFESDSYYIKCFRQEYGMTPFQWVKNNML